MQTAYRLGLDLGTNSIGCTNVSAPVTVNINGANPVAITPNGPTTFCPGGSVTLTATGAESYAWSNGATTESIVVSNSGSYAVTGTNAGGCTSAAAPVVVSVNPAPTVSINAGGPTTFCEGGSVTLSGSGAVSYVWSTGATTASIVVSNPGSYGVTGTDANGCTAASTPMTVAVNPLPEVSVDANGPTTFCEGGSVSLIATGATSYLWSNNATTSSILVSTPGSYSVVGTNANGCSSASAPVSVSVNPLPEVSINAGGPTTFCEGGSVTLTASGATSYLWSNNATTNSIVVTQAGSYAVTGTNANGCSSASAPTAVTVNPLPEVSINAGGPTTFCEGGSVALTASGASSYLWSNNATTTSIVVSTPGSYTVTGTDANGCSSASAPTTVSVNPLPTVSIVPSGPTSVCTGGSVELVATGASSYVWSNGATTSSINAGSGTYSVTGTDANGCSAASAPITVSVNTPPTVSIVPSGPTTVCGSGSVVLSANGASSYVWSNGATTASITVDTNGSYSVTGTDANGCTGASAAVSFVSNPTPTVSISPNGTVPVCAGTTTTLTASGAASYVWSNGATTSSITVGAGTYNVTGTDANGCTAASANVTVSTLSNPTCTLNAPSILPVSGSTTNTLSVSSNGVSRVWTLTSSDNSWLIIGSNTGTSITYKAGTAGTTGTFTVVTTSAAGCTSTCSVTFGTMIGQYCSYTQGFYGGNGKTCDNKTNIQAVTQALSSGPLEIGDGSRKLTILPSQASCLIGKMPSGSTPAILPVGNVTCATATGSAYLTNGKFKSILVGQTIALSLNVRLNPALGTIVIANKYMTTYASTACVNGVAKPGTKKVFFIPQSVITYLGANNTVNDLIALANKALGGTYVPTAGQPTLSDITTALDAFNMGFDGCRILAGFSANSSGLKADEEIDGVETIASGLTVSAYPNPFSNSTTVTFTLDETTDATLEVYSVTGQRIASLFNGTANGGQTYEATFDASQLATGMYLCKLTTANNAAVHKVILMK